jgi:hypothetical protein
MDIKSSNIFIGDIDAGYQFYRRPLLADFDLAIKPDDYSAEALQKERNQGTEGWKPPVRFAAHLLNLTTDDVIGANHDEHKCRG